MCSSTVPELVQGFKNSTGNIHIDKHDIPLYHEITMFDGYHLVMTFTVCHGFVPPIFKNGKPSISIRAIYTMAMLVITRWYIPLNPIKPSFSYGFPMGLSWDSPYFDGPKPTSTSLLRSPPWRRRTKRLQSEVIFSKTKRWFFMGFIHEKWWFHGVYP